MGVDRLLGDGSRPAEVELDDRSLVGAESDDHLAQDAAVHSAAVAVLPLVALDAALVRSASMVRRAPNRR